MEAISASVLQLTPEKVLSQEPFNHLYKLLLQCMTFEKNEQWGTLTVSFTHIISHYMDHVLSPSPLS